jgi:hypothetical protein
MNDSNEILTRTIDKELGKRTSNSVEKQLNIARQYTEKIAKGEKSIHVWADIV